MIWNREAETLDARTRAALQLERLQQSVAWAIERVPFHRDRLSGGRLSTNRPSEHVGTLFLVSRGRKTGTLRRNGLFFVEDGQLVGWSSLGGGSGTLALSVQVDESAWSP